MGKALEPDIIKVSLFLPLILLILHSLFIYFLSIRRPSANGQSAITEALNLAGYSGEDSKHPSLSLPPPLPPPIHPLSVTSSASTARGHDVPSSTDGDDNDEDDESFSADTADSPDPLHILFNFVLNFRNNLGQLLSEPFMRLPNSRIYPDYYREIKKPIALTKIRSKLKVRMVDIFVFSLALSFRRGSLIANLFRDNGALTLLHNKNA